MFVAKIFIFCLLLVIIPCQSCYCSEEAQEQEVLAVSGRIVAVDWVGATLTLRLIFPGGISDEMIFQVSANTKITKGGYSLILGELQMQDRVTIEYLNKRFQGLQAVNIMVAS